jgi:hypothetical protein
VPRRFAGTLYFPFCLFPNPGDLLVSSLTNTLPLGLSFHFGSFRDSFDFCIQIGKSRVKLGQLRQR